MKMCNKSIFDVGASVLVNPVNCVGFMGAGLALQFRRRYPKMFKKYVEDCRNQKYKLGAVEIFQENKNLYIANFPTKKHWKESSQIEDISSGLLNLFVGLQEINIQHKVIALPLLGAGLGGLDKLCVCDIMQKSIGRHGNDDWEFIICVDNLNDYKELLNGKRNANWDWDWGSNKLET